MASHVKKPSGRTQISKKCLLGRQWIRWKSQRGVMGLAALSQMGVLGPQAISWWV